MSISIFFKRYVANSSVEKKSARSVIKRYTHVLPLHRKDFFLEVDRAQNFFRSVSNASKLSERNKNPKPCFTTMFSSNIWFHYACNFFFLRWAVSPCWIRRILQPFENYELWRWFCSSIIVFQIYLQDILSVYIWMFIVDLTQILKHANLSWAKPLHIFQFCSLFFGTVLYPHPTENIKYFFKILLRNLTFMEKCQIYWGHSESLLEFISWWLAGQKFCCSW